MQMDVFSSIWWLRWRHYLSRPVKSGWSFYTQTLSKYMNYITNNALPITCRRPVAVKVKISDENPCIGLNKPIGTWPKLPLPILTSIVNTTNWINVMQKCLWITVCAFLIHSVKDHEPVPRP